MSVKVSVVVTVGNDACNLRKCLDSLAAQTLLEFEIICVDGGSDDQSCKVLKEYAAKDSRLTVLPQKNPNRGAARNRGLDAVSGNYVVFLDDDVMCAPSLLEKMYSRATAVEADVVVCNGRAFDLSSGRNSRVSNYFRVSELRRRAVFSVKDFPRHILTLANPVPWNKCYRRRFLRQENLRFQELSDSSDLYMVLLALCVAHRISYVDEPLVIRCKKGRAHLEAHKSSAPLCFIEALAALHDELQRRQIYSLVERDFVSMAAQLTAWNVVTAGGWSSRVAILRSLEDEKFAKMSILGRPRAYYTELSQYCGARFVQGTLRLYKLLHGKP